MGMNKKGLICLFSISLTGFIGAMDAPSGGDGLEKEKADSEQVIMSKQSLWNFMGARAQEFVINKIFLVENRIRLSLCLLAYRYIHDHIENGVTKEQENLFINSFITIGSAAFPQMLTCDSSGEQIIPDISGTLHMVYEQFFTPLYSDIGLRVAAFEKFIGVFAKDVDSVAILKTPSGFAQKIKVYSKEELLCDAPKSYITDNEKLGQRGVLRTVGAWVKRTVGSIGSGMTKYVFRTLPSNQAAVDWIEVPLFTAMVDGMSQGIIVAPPIEVQQQIIDGYQKLLPVEAYVYLRMLADVLVGQKVALLSALTTSQKGGESDQVLSQEDKEQLIVNNQYIDTFLMANDDIFTTSECEKCDEIIQQAVISGIGSGKKMDKKRCSELSDQTYARYMLDPRVIHVLMENQQKADRFISSLYTLWAKILPGSQTVDELSYFLSLYAPQVLAQEFFPKLREQINAQKDKKDGQNRSFMGAPGFDEKGGSDKREGIAFGGSAKEPEKKLMSPSYGGVSPAAANQPVQASSSAPMTGGRESSKGRSSAPATSYRGGQPYYGTQGYKPSTPARSGYAGTAGYGMASGGTPQGGMPPLNPSQQGAQDTKVACWSQSDSDNGTVCIEVYTGPFYPALGEVKHQKYACIYTKRTAGPLKKLCLVEEEKKKAKDMLKNEEVKGEQSAKKTFFSTKVMVSVAVGGGVMVVLLILLFFFVL